MLPHEHDRRRTFSVAAFVFAIVFGAYLYSPIVISSDSRWVIPTAESLLTEGNSDIDEFAEIDLPNYAYSIVTARDHTYSLFPIGPVFLALPFVKLYLEAPHLFSVLPGFASLTERSLRRTGHPPSVLEAAPLIERLIGSLVTACAAVVIFFTALLTLTHRQSVFVAFVFAFCTSAWSIASRGLWQHGPSMLCLALAVFLVARAETRGRPVLWAGLALALAYVMRPTNVIPLVGFSLYVLWRFPRERIGYCLAVLLPLLPWMLYNQALYDSPLAPYYIPGREGYSTTVRAALWGHLFSPGRGLFVYSPILLFALVSLGQAFRRGSGTSLSLLLVGCMLSHWILVAYFPRWWGGHSFGPRLMSDLIPFFMTGLIPLVQSIQTVGLSRIGKLSLSLALAMSFLIHARGAWSYQPHLWNTKPLNVDLHPERLWDWQDPPFLR